MALSLKDRKVQIAVAGAVVVALIAVLFVTGVIGGGGGSESAAPPVINGGGAPVVAPSTTPTPKVEATLVFSGRDPFQALFSTGGGSSSSPTDTGSGGTSTPPPTTSGSGGSTPPSGTSGGHPSSTTIGGHSVQLDDVFVSTSGTRKAQVEVDGTVYTVAAGQSFDDNFQLVSFPNATCANMVFGEEAFTLCTAGGK